MKLTEIDLNLLVVFDRLVQDGRVSRVAESLGLSQPAVSNALRRLRDLLDDELFLRTPTGMAPTPYALQLAEPVAQALRGLQGALNVRASFDPATSERCFTLAMTDVGEIYFLPVLMDALAREAPGVTLRCVPVADAALREDMAAGRVDLALGSLPQLQAGFFQQALFRQRYVALMRAGHPLATASAAPLNATQYRQAAHVRVVSAGTGHGQVDEALQRLGVARQVQLTVPHYVALGQVLGSTDLVATVPERLAERLAGPHALVARPLTLRLPASTIAQLWHAHLHRDPGHQWLRGLVAQRFGTAAAAVDGL
ncbi:LysR family transcriptional regulator [Hydrogenophaga pseudoflava]|uniref:LysR family transcriptional regulator n=1 Tax=Hydrogenophaga pseudoflava TaxID=47421 RepID=UPI0027E42F06|nr:LysR family transcriptional regulator [Hydrogenophaga pseudoflava]MDQ7745223.1 LysR family transcriptional regulator [Hydrogenophaga pseudoflava]